MIHDATIVNKERKDRKTNIEIKKPYAVQYSKFIKDVDRADQCLTNYLVLKKTVKWSKKVVLYMLNCVLFNAFFVYSTLNTNEVKELRAWVGKVLDIGSPESKWVKFWWLSIAREGGLNRTHRWFLNTQTWKKCWQRGGGKKKYPARQCTVCAAHKKRSIWKYCVVPIHKGPSFEKYNSVTNY